MARKFDNCVFSNWIILELVRVQPKSISRHLVRSSPAVMAACSASDRPSLLTLHSNMMNRLKNMTIAGNDEGYLNRLVCIVYFLVLLSWVQILAVGEQYGFHTAFGWRLAHYFTQLFGMQKFCIARLYKGRRCFDEYCSS